MLSRTIADMERDFNRRVLFDTVADLYAELRPSYPDELVDDVVRLSGIEPEGRILEVGAGPGQATRMFAARGYSITAIELGANMAALARESVAEFPKAEVLNVAFEDWEVERGAFDLVISGSAFHWIPADVGFPRCSQALKPERCLALFWNGDPKPSGGIYDAVKKVYERLAPEMTRDRHHTDETHRERTEAFAASGLFGSPVVKEYEWSREMTGEEYARLCCTYSDHLALPADRLQDLCEGIRSVVEAHGNVFERRYVTRLYVARKGGGEDGRG